MNLKYNPTNKQDLIAIVSEVNQTSTKLGYNDIDKDLVISKLLEWVTCDYNKESKTWTLKTESDGITIGSINWKFKKMLKEENEYSRYTVQDLKSNDWELDGLTKEYNELDEVEDDVIEEIFEGNEAAIDLAKIMKAGGTTRRLAVKLGLCTDYHYSKLVKASKK